ncbi:MAG: hypothetical protein V1792_09750 [Pseudomonadota bacterium]
MTTTDLIWRGPSGVQLPGDASTAGAIVPYAQALTVKQQASVVQAFERGAFDMGAEYVWRRAMIRLRSSLESLGTKFIGEMLGNPDIDEFTNIEAVLTDYQTITLSGQLGVINSTGTLKLKQALEVITHFFSRKAEQDGEELSAVDGIQIISACVKYVLGEHDLGVAVEFSKLRDKLFSTTLQPSDPQVQQLLSSPTFYVRTVVQVLLSSAKSGDGAQLENSLANINLFLPMLWPNMPETDRWAVGIAYRDVTSEGRILAAKGLKQALLKVGGFDYVPETLRSTTYRKAAKAVIDAHFNFNNFYTEPPLVSTLLRLGSTVPAPAVIDCIQAYLVVILGNHYGISYRAADLAKQGINGIAPERWMYYLNAAIPTDEVVLHKLSYIERAAGLFSEIVKDKVGPADRDQLKGAARKLALAALEGNAPRIREVAKSLLNKLNS